MNKEEFKELFKEIARELLSIECKKCHGSYGSSDWIEVSLLIDKEVINTEYIDLPKE